MALNDTIQLSVHGTVGGQIHIHTLGFRFTEALDNEAALISAWQTACRTAWRALFSNADNPCQYYVARQICGTVPLRAPAEATEATATAVGTRTSLGERLPTFLAAVASTRTALAGRSRRGRYFIGGSHELDQNAGELTVAYWNLMNGYSNALMGAFGPTGTDPGGYTLVVHSGKLASVPGTQCQASSTPIIGILNRTTLGTMKSRKPGSGR